MKIFFFYVKLLIGDDMDNKCGSFEIICGPMFSGKTEELIRRVRRLIYAKKKYVIFNPKIQKEFEFEDVASHNGDRLTAVPINSAADILTYLRKNQDIEFIAIDSIHFLDNYIVKLLKALKTKGYKIIATGLDKDFRGEPFGPMAELLVLADGVTKLSAVCTVCGKDAYYTQRIVKGEPASFNDEIIDVVEENYEARCLEHHELKDREELKIF